MLKIILFVSFFLLFSSLEAQTINNKEIIAEGGAKIKVKPDVAIFTFSVNKKDTIEKNAIKMLNLEIDELVKSLYKIGFTSKTIKISDYDISSYQNEVEKKKYTASNVLKLEFGLDTKLINEIYTEIQEAGLEDLDVLFDSKVSDSLEKVTRIKLVKDAIADAKLNAKNISQELDIKQIKVKQVLKYKESVLSLFQNVNKIKFLPPKPVGDVQVMANASTSFDKFELEYVELEEKITIVYEILK